MTHYHKPVTSVSLRFDHSACESETATVSETQGHPAISNVSEASVWLLNMQQLALLAKGKLQCSMGNFLIQSKQNIPFNFKVTLQEAQIEKLEEDLVCLNTHRDDQKIIDV